jgi:hypothetical protein
MPLKLLAGARCAQQHLLAWQAGVDMLSPSTAMLS